MKNVRLMAKIGISAGLMALLLWKIDVREAVRAASSAQPLFLTGAGVLVALSRLMICVRVRMLLGAHGISITFPAIAKLFWKCDFAGTFLPGSLGSDALRVIGLGRGHSELRHAVSAIAMDRVLGFAAFWVLALVGSALGAVLGIVPVSVSGIVAASGVLAGVFLTALFYFKEHVERSRASKSRLLEKVKETFQSFVEYAEHRDVLVKALFLSLVIQSGRVCTAFLIAEGLHLDVPFLYLFICVPLAFFATLIPVSVGGWGVQEGAYVAILSVIGIPAAGAFTLSVLSSLVTIGVALPGLVFFAKEGFVKKRVSLEAVR